ncbi:MAG: alfa-L-rhamnosidase [Ruminococcaceae bacterium]|nr:alfa-L-rhamnosidase [Oscillospiraceae bacterium]
MFERAKWITAGEDFKESLPSFRKKLICKGAVKKATAFMTAFGVYDFFIDGQKVGNRLMAPGWTYYTKWIQYQEYDITELLKGEHTLSVTVAPGWAAGFIGHNRRKLDPYPGPYGIHHTSMVAEIEVEYADGTKETVLSDESWDIYTTETLYCQLYDGLRVDYTREPRFVGKAQNTQCPVPEVLPQKGENVVERETILPQKLILTPKGERVIDFGQNLAGYLEIRAKGNFGDKLAFSYGEVLDRDGNFYNDNYRDAKNETTYILDGKERVLKPSFTFQGFRYVRVDEYPGELDLNDFSARVIYSDMKRVGDFSCGNEKLNQLYSNMIWSMRGNYIDVPTDCPQRNERLGWTGDAQVFCRTAALNYDVKRFFRKWLYDMGRNQGEDGAVFGVIPTLGFYTAKISTAWGDAATVCPWEMYRAYGDKDFLRDCYPMMKKWVEYMHAFGEDEFLWVGGRHYGDWLAMDAGEDYYVGATQTDLIASAYFAYSVSLTVRAGKVLGEDTKELEALYQNVRRSFREAFMEKGLPKVYPKADGLAENREKTIQMDRPVKDVTQTAILLILHFGLCEEDEKAVLVDKLVELIEDFDGRMSTGFVGTPLILRVLSDNGRADVAFDLLLQEKNPSWFFSVDHGATTIWEHWDSQKEDGSFWSTAMNSFNHYAYGSVYDWMFGDMVGLTVCDDGAGYERVTYRPHTDPRIGFARASLETCRGTLAASWRYLEDGTVRYELTLPESTTALVTLPGHSTKTLRGGSYVFYSK